MGAYSSLTSSPSPNKSSTIDIPRVSNLGSFIKRVRIYFNFDRKTSIIAFKKNVNSKMNFAKLIVR